MQKTGEAQTWSPRQADSDISFQGVRCATKSDYQYYVAAGAAHLLY